HVDHVVRMTRELWLVPGRQSEDAKLLGPPGDLGKGLHHPDVLVTALRIDDEDALAVEGVLEHGRPENARGLARAGLAADVPVDRLLPLADVDGAPRPP